jgi:hypothetical protein
MDQLSQVRAALHQPRLTPRPLNCGQQNSDQDRNNADHDQQLDQREGTTLGTRKLHAWLLLRGREG